MISIHRLHSALYPAHSGEGAALFGGRWNPVGIPVIYAAQSASLAALEVLVHYSVLPKNYHLTEIRIPDSLAILTKERSRLPEDWKRDTPPVSTQRIGQRWVEDAQSAVLRAPSSIVPGEYNYLINPAHADFAVLLFQPPRPFAFDPRLKR